MLPPAFPGSTLMLSRVEETWLNSGDFENVPAGNGEVSSSMDVRNLSIWHRVGEVRRDDSGDLEKLPRDAKGSSWRISAVFVRRCGFVIKGGNALGKSKFSVCE